MKRGSSRTAKCTTRLAVVAVMAVGGVVAMPAAAVATTYATARPPIDVLPVNPAAEIGRPGLAGWIGTPGYTATAYGTPGDFPDAAVSASIAAGSGTGGGGAMFFDPGNEPNARLVQDVDLTAFAARISSGEVNDLGLVAFLGGFGSSPDTVDIQLTPLDALGQALVTPTRIPGPTASERGNQTMLAARGDHLPLPSASRSVRLELIATGQPGQKNHGYADEIILMLGNRPSGPIYQTPAGGGPSSVAQTIDRQAPPTGPAPDPGIPGRPTITFGKQAPVLLKRNRGLLLDPRATVACPDDGLTCPVTLKARTRAGEVIATGTVKIRANGTARPRLTVKAAAARKLRRGARIRVTIDVAAAVGRRPPSATATRNATLQLPTTKR
ncbi:hypothetical protein [Conexibacter sp. CPCC 206217]|uniref:hypothetical protein n=1 Tax=Conexibacter sp. CPCC 206217 TaxID=3064574 RepID=UPI00272685DF|nr:hypothetical protein [Conexibacter sp. CPCC 206217]MDO8213197.1 hypothetical protein [Conexibacter sp. CPCC 206217]